MSNIIQDFRITNNLIIDDGSLQVKTNDTTNTLDISGGINATDKINIGNLIKASGENSLIIKNSTDPKVELFSLDGTIENGVKFENKQSKTFITPFKKNDSDNIVDSSSVIIDLSGHIGIGDIIPTRPLEINVGNDNSIAFMDGSGNNLPGIVFGYNGNHNDNTAFGVAEYVNPHIFLDKANTRLCFTSENISLFNLTGDMDNASNFLGANSNNAALTIEGNQVGIKTANPIVSLDVRTTDALRIPVGTNADRPNQTAPNTFNDAVDCSGCIRYNSETTQFEGWSPTGNSWIGLGGVIDIDQDTYVAAEENSDEDKLRFYTAGTQKMIVDTNGNVGINKNTPVNYKLDIQGTLNASGATTLGDTLNVTGETKVDDTLGVTGATTLSDTLGVTGATTLSDTLNVSGNVGIGTTSPEAKLHISHSTSNDADAKNVVWPIWLTNQDMVVSDNTNGGVGIRFDSYDSQNSGNVNAWSGIAGISEGATYRPEYTSLAFYCGTSTDHGEKMRIKYNGKVGIGTTSPDSTFHIKSSGGTGTSATRLIIDGNGNDAILHLVESSDGWNLRHKGSDNTLRFSNVLNGTDYITFTSSGNVGIGTTSPGEKLEVNGTIKATNLKTQYFETNTNQLNTSSANLYLQHNNNRDVIMCTGGGDVGIGTTSPEVKLDVNGSLLVRSMTFHVTGAGSPPKGIFFRDGYTTDAKAFHLSILAYGHDNHTDGLSINGYDGISFCTNSDGIGNTLGRNERMRITKAGNVGIGTTSPGSALHVVGSIDYATPAQGIHMGSDNDASIEIVAKSATFSSYIDFGIPNENHRGRILYDHSDQKMKFGTNANYNMVINTYGNVGIGTLTPHAPFNVYYNSGTTGTGKHIIARLDLECNSGTTVSNGYGASLRWGVPRDAGGPHEAGYMDCYIYSGANSVADYYAYDFRLRADDDIKTVMTMRGIGRVGIGTTSPSYSLSVAGTMGIEINAEPHFVYNRTTSNTYYSTFKDTYQLTMGAGNGRFIRKEIYHNTEYMHGWHCQRVGSYNGHYLHFQHRAPSGNREQYMYVNGSSGYVYFDKGHGTSSDRRIKKDIIDVPDDLSLYLLRNIPVRYYNYIDDSLNKETPHQTIGFIAQEVNEVFPIAVSDSEIKVIPSERRILNNFSWEELENDASSNTIHYKLYTDISCSKGDVYEFNMYDKFEDNHEKVLAVCDGSGVFIYDKNNKYAFSEKYNIINVEGKEVNDFHFLCKDKLFALNFSATQEIDKIQQAEKIKLENTIEENIRLKNKIANLEAKQIQLEQLIQNLISKNNLTT